MRQGERSTSKLVSPKSSADIVIENLPAIEQSPTEEGNYSIYESFLRSLQNGHYKAILAVEIHRKW